ncbi:MAG TPA: hypothetical protein VIF60_03975, partial [Burkholderiaceae bacterium]
ANTDAAPRKRFIRSWWQVPLGLAAGVLLTIAFRTQFEGSHHPESIALSSPPPVAAVSAPRDAAPAEKSAQSVARAAKIVENPPALAPTSALAATSSPVASPRAVPEMAYAPPPLVQRLPAPPPQAQVPAYNAPITSGAIGVPPTLAARVARATQEADAAQPKSIAANDVPTDTRQELKQPRDAIAQIEVGKQNETLKKSDFAAQEYKRRAADTDMRVAAAPAGPVYEKPDARADRAANAERANTVEQAIVAAKPVPQEHTKPALEALVPPPAGAPAPVTVTAASPNAANEHAASLSQSGAGLVAQSPRNETRTDNEAGSQKVSAQLSADAWLAVIEQKLKTHDEKTALHEWSKFRESYPDYVVDKALEAKLKALQASSVRSNSSAPNDKKE